MIMDTYSWPRDKVLDETIGVQLHTPVLKDDNKKVVVVVGTGNHSVRFL